MTVPDRYDAFWIPGPYNFDTDEGLRFGYRWLDTAPYRGERVVVLYAKKMVNNRRTLAEANRYHVVSPRARDIPYTSAGPVLAIWPNADTLEFAQQLALDSALCPARSFRRRGLRARERRDERRGRAPSGSFYEKILAGRQLRDYRGRAI